MLGVGLRLDVGMWYGLIWVSCYLAVVVCGVTVLPGLGFCECCGVDFRVSLMVGCWR